MTRHPISCAGLVLGVGLGGFFDGIVLHQILGLHHLICTTATCAAPSVEHLKRQNTQDGFFHLGMWIVTVAGIVLLFRAVCRGQVQPSGRTLAGAMLAGWGLFNFVEGLINHQLLGIHHVLPGHTRQLLFDLLFLGSGALLVLIGMWMARIPAPKPRAT